MYYVGIAIHKRYSVCATQDERGRWLGGARIGGNSAALYDRLVALLQVAEVVVAHPLKTRLIGEAQIKSDKIDARALSTLLRGNLLPRVHVPAKAVRQRKDTLRQRLYFVRLRTAHPQRMT